MGSRCLLLGSKEGTARRILLPWQPFNAQSNYPVLYFWLLNCLIMQFDGTDINIFCNSTPSTILCNSIIVSLSNEKVWCWPKYLFWDFDNCIRFRKCLLQKLYCIRITPSLCMLTDINIFCKNGAITFKYGTYIKFWSNWKSNHLCVCTTML